MGLRLIRALPGAPGFLATVAGAIRMHRRQRDTSVGVSGPRDFAVRLPSFVRMHEHTAAEAGHRIPHQRFVTFAKRPSIGTGCGDDIMNSEKKKQQYF